MVQVSECVPIGGDAPGQLIVRQINTKQLGKCVPVSGDASCQLIVGQVENIQISESAYVYCAKVSD